jgi:hypothetical protein
MKTVGLITHTKQKTANNGRKTADCFGTRRNNDNI